MRFVKMHGLGNDHVVVENSEYQYAVNASSSMGVSQSELVQLMCDRRYGVGGNGVLVIGESSVADISMRAFNSDGTEAEMCGNGIRCVGKYAFEHGLVCSSSVSVETGSGVRTLAFDIDHGIVEAVRVEMGVPDLPGLGVEDSVSYSGGVIPFTRVSMGNPHAVILSDDPVQGLELADIAHAICSRVDLFPNGVNVEAAHAEGDGRTLRARVFERGCGETEACGTGACATAVAYYLHGGSRRLDGPLTICMPGGLLSIEWEGLGCPIYMTGPADQVFTGKVDLHDLLKSHL